MSNDINNQRKEENIQNEVKQIISYEGLTDKEKLFCLYYIRSFNATRAYMKAYDVKYESAAVLANKLLKKENIKNCINDLKQNRLNREMMTEEDIFQKYMDIAFADINDYMCIKDNEVVFKDSSDFDGSLVKRVTVGKGAVISLELQDQMKALQWLTDHMDMATERQKAELQVLKAKAAESDSKSESDDDGFIQALEGKVDEVWQDE